MAAQALALALPVPLVVVVVVATAVAVVKVAVVEVVAIVSLSLSALSKGDTFVFTTITGPSPAIEIPNLFTSYVKVKSSLVPLPKFCSVKN